MVMRGAGGRPAALWLIQLDQVAVDVLAAVRCGASPGRARAAGGESKQEIGTTDAHRCTPMGLSPACSFTETPGR